MLISQALISLNSYPIPSLFIEKVGIDRGLAVSDSYTLGISESEAFELATADVYLYLFTAPDLKEQEVSISQADRDNFLSMANNIYSKYNDPKFIGITYGFIGENYNG